MQVQREVIVGPRNQRVADPASSSSDEYSTDTSDDEHADVRPPLRSRPTTAEDLESSVYISDEERSMPGTAPASRVSTVSFAAGLVQDGEVFGNIRSQSPPAKPALKKSPSYISTKELRQRLPGQKPLSGDVAQFVHSTAQTSPNVRASSSSPASKTWERQQDILSKAPQLLAKEDEFNWLEAFWIEANKRVLAKAKPSYDPEADIIPAEKGDTVDPSDEVWTEFRSLFNTLKLKVDSRFQLLQQQHTNTLDALHAKEHPRPDPFVEVEPEDKSAPEHNDLERFVAYLDNPDGVIATATPSPAFPQSVVAQKATSPSSTMASTPVSSKSVSFGPTSSAPAAVPNNGRADQLQAPSVMLKEPYSDFLEDAHELLQRFMTSIDRSSIMSTMFMDELSKRIQLCDHLQDRAQYFENQWRQSERELAREKVRAEKRQELLQHVRTSLLKDIVLLKERYHRLANEQQTSSDVWLADIASWWDQISRLAQFDDPMNSTMSSKDNRSPTNGCNPSALTFGSMKAEFVSDPQKDERIAQLQQELEANKDLLGFYRRECETLNVKMDSLSARFNEREEKYKRDKDRYLEGRREVAAVRFAEKAMRVQLQNLTIEHTNQINDLRMQLMQERREVSKLMDQTWVRLNINIHEPIVIQATPEAQIASVTRKESSSSIASVKPMSHMDDLPEERVQPSVEAARVLENEFGGEGEEHVQELVDERGRLIQVVYGVEPYDPMDGHVSNYTSIYRSDSDRSLRGPEPNIDDAGPSQVGSLVPTPRGMDASHMAGAALLSARDTRDMDTQVPSHRSSRSSTANWAQHASRPSPMLPEYEPSEAGRPWSNSTCSRGDSLYGSGMQKPSTADGSVSRRASAFHMEGYRDSLRSIDSSRPVMPKVLRVMVPKVEVGEMGTDTLELELSVEKQRYVEEQQMKAEFRKLVEEQLRIQIMREASRDNNESIAKELRQIDSLQRENEELMLQLRMLRGALESKEIAAVIERRMDHIATQLGPNLLSAPSKPGSTVYDRLYEEGMSLVQRMEQRRMELLQAREEGLLQTLKVDEVSRNVVANMDDRFVGFMIRNYADRSPNPRGQLNRGPPTDFSSQQQKPQLSAKIMASAGSAPPRASSMLNSTVTTFAARGSPMPLSLSVVAPKPASTSPGPFIPDGYVIVGTHQTPKSSHKKVRPSFQSDQGNIVQMDPESLIPPQPASDKIRVPVSASPNASTLSAVHAPHVVAHDISALSAQSDHLLFYENYDPSRFDAEERNTGQLSSETVVKKQSSHFVSQRMPDQSLSLAGATKELREPQPRRSQSTQPSVSPKLSPQVVLRDAGLPDIGRQRTSFNPSKEALRVLHAARSNLAPKKMPRISQTDAPKPGPALDSRYQKVTDNLYMVMKPPG